MRGRALPAVIASFVAGLATLWLVYRRIYEPARYGAALAVAAVIAGWALSRWPTILSGLTVAQAAAGHDALVWVVVSVLGGAVILFPSLALLFRLALTGRFRAPEAAQPESVAPRPVSVRSGLPARVAAACLLAGFGLLNVADARWAHAVGVVCLFAFVLFAFRAIIFGVLRSRPASN
jgi:cytochrome d ubiquinol oxidase subunit II